MKAGEILFPTILTLTGVVGCHQEHPPRGSIEVTAIHQVQDGKTFAEIEREINDRMAAVARAECVQRGAKLVHVTTDEGEIEQACLKLQTLKKQKDTCGKDQRLGLTWDHQQLPMIGCFSVARDDKESRSYRTLLQGW